MRRALFLGAGFSYDFAQPLVAELTQEFRQFLTPEKLIQFNKGWRAQGGGHSDESIERVATILRQTNLNYEQIIGAIEVQTRRHKNRHILQDLHGIKEWILEFVSYLLHYRHTNNSNYLKTAIQLHRGFKSIISADEPLWVFSLNHDLIVEMIAGELSIPLRDGFDDDDALELYFGEREGKRLPVKFSRLRMAKKLPDNYPWKYFQYGRKNEGGINILKLHGSLNIFGFDDLKSYLCPVPKMRTVDGYLEMLHTLNDVISIGPPKFTNHVAGHDSAGEIQILGRSLLSGVYKFTGKLSQVVSDKTLLLFQSSLNYAEQLTIIGYGFGDQHVNNIIRDWLEFTDDRSIVIVGPSCEIPGFIAHLSSQIKLETKTTIDYFASLPGGELSPDEKKSHELRQSVRGLSKQEAGKVLVENALAEILKKIQK